MKDFQEKKKKSKEGHSDSQKISKMSSSSSHGWEADTALLYKGDIQVNDGMNGWINLFIISPCILVNLVPRNHTALKSALRYLCKCTHRCVGAASLGPAHSPSSHFFTKC